MKTLLFYARGIGEYTDFLTTAKRLVGDYEIVIAGDFPLDIYGQANIKEKAEEAGIFYHDMYARQMKMGRSEKYKILARNIHITLPMFLLSLASNIVDLNLKFGDIYERLYSIYRLMAKQHIFDEVLARKDFLVLVVNSVNGGTLSELFIACARRRGIKSLLVPLNCMTPVAPARKLYEDAQSITKGIKLRIVKKLFPEWLYFYNHMYLLRKPALEILTLKALKGAPPLPWVQDSSTADVMIVESMFLQEHYKSLGLHHENMQVTGKPNHDYLHSLHIQKDTLKRRLHAELGFSEEKPFLLLAIPPRVIGFKEKEGRASEFNDYEEIVSFLLEAVSHIRNFNILVCLHPKERARLAEAIYRQDSLPGHVRYSTRDTAELMAASELYIMAGSTTVLWALALKLPVIDYDAYGFRFKFYEGNSDVEEISSKDAFRQLIKRIDEDPDYLRQKKRSIQEKGDYYGVLDGKSIERIKRIMDALYVPQKGMV